MMSWQDTVFQSQSSRDSWRTVFKQTGMHHKWNQQSGNRGSDLYVTTVDDFIQALMQVIRYYQYLKGDRASTGPGKEELQLRVAQHTAERTGDPKVLNFAMAKLPRAELFCTCEPHLAGKEIFGS
jgi:hypothetical protein